jgi:hypothetical protein
MAFQWDPFFGISSMNNPQQLSQSDSTPPPAVENTSNSSASKPAIPYKNTLLIPESHMVDDIDTEHRTVNCLPALPETVDVFLGIAKPLLKAKSECNGSKKTNEVDYYEEQPMLKNFYGSDARARWEKKHKEWLEVRNKREQESSDLLAEATKNPVTLEDLLLGQLPPGSRYEAGEYEMVGTPVETKVPGISPLVLAAHKCFVDHRPLSLKPDDLLLPIVQAVGVYLLSMDQQMVREKYFKRSGKIELVVTTLTDPKLYWDQVFDKFAELIAEELGKEARDGLRAKFTTTGRFQNAAYDMALMNATRSVFEYRTDTRCGIPYVELRGTPADWIELGEKILSISKILSDPTWTALLKEKIVDPLQSAALAAQSGSVSEAGQKREAEHWASFYKYQSTSGGASVTGWISYLFPYMLYKPRYREVGPVTWKKLTVKEMTEGERELGSFMPGFSTVPMKWSRHDQGPDVKVYDMRLLAGQVGVTQREDKYIQPLWGWGVYYA